MLDVLLACVNKMVVVVVVVVVCAGAGARTDFLYKITLFQTTRTVHASRL
jgi:hypothetical protein